MAMGASSTLIQNTDPLLHLDAAPKQLCEKGILDDLYYTRMHI